MKNAPTKSVKELKKEYDAARYRAKKEQIIEKSKEYYHANKNELNEKRKEYRANSKEKIRVKDKIWKKNNPDKVKKHARDGYHRNKKSIMKTKKMRYNTDMNYRLKIVLRGRLSSALRNNKAGSAVKDLGCTVAELRLYLESKFQPGMGWDNYGRSGWHIDHILPLSKFDLGNPTEFKKACHYSNLQPLWATDNLRKSNKGDLNA